MRPSATLCLLIALVFVVHCSARRKDKTPDRKNQPSGRDKNKVKADKQVKKEEDVDEEEEDEEEEESENETESEDTDDEDDDDEDDDDEEDEDEDNVTLFKSEEFEGDRRDQIQEKGIFYDVETIKNFLVKPDFQGDSEIEEVLRRYNNSEFLIQEKIAANPEKPLQQFYVVEGVNPDTRRKVAQILAHRLRGLYIVNQPRILLGPLPKESEAKKAYYALSKYAIANKIRISLLNKPVVCESYWMEHASFIMGKVWGKATQLPKPGAEVYRFPEDLLVPNTTFAIFNTPAPRLGRKPSRKYLLEQRMLLVYKRFTGAKVHIIRFPESAKVIADKIDLYLRGMAPRYSRHDTFEITFD